jgi:ribosomal-protein-alanine N-acetyltransferase
VVSQAFIPPSLALGRHVLRPFRREDARAWHDYLSDPRVTEHTSWPPVTAELITTLVEKIIEDYAEPKSLRFALARVDDDAVIGSCGFTRWDREQRTAELAYDLARAYWGRGLMTAAVNAAVGWAFSTDVLSHIEAFVMTTNEPSIAVLERTGFQRQAMLAGHRQARGVPRDFYLYRRSRSV